MILRGTDSLAKGKKGQDKTMLLESRLVLPIIAYTTSARKTNVYNPKIYYSYG